MPEFHPRARELLQAMRSCGRGLHSAQRQLTSRGRDIRGWKSTVTVNASNLLSDSSSVGPTRENKLSRSRRASRGNLLSKVKPVRPRPKRDTGLGIARAQWTRGPNVSRSLERGTPAARLTAISGRFTIRISFNNSAIADGRTAMIRSWALLTARCKSGSTWTPCCRCTLRRFLA